MSLEPLVPLVWGADLRTGLVVVSVAQVAAALDLVGSTALQVLEKVVLFVMLPGGLLM